MNNKDILNICNAKSIEELGDLIYNLIQLRKTKWNEKFITIRVYPGNIIVEQIQRETGFFCYHEPSINSSGRGTHVIVLPLEKYNDGLKEQLIKKYNDE